MSNWSQRRGNPTQMREHLVDDCTNTAWQSQKARDLNELSIKTPMELNKGEEETPEINRCNNQQQDYKHPTVLLALLQAALKQKRKNYDSVL